jgi:hypothetical protein
MKATVIRRLGIALLVAASVTPTAVAKAVDYAPDAPRGLVATNVDGTQMRVNLKFQNPANAAVAPVKEYKVEWVANGGGDCVWFTYQSLTTLSVAAGKSADPNASFDETVTMPTLVNNQSAAGCVTQIRVSAIGTSATDANSNAVGMVTPRKVPLWGNSGPAGASGIQSLSIACAIRGCVKVTLNVTQPLLRGSTLKTNPYKVQYSSNNTTWFQPDNPTATCNLQWQLTITCRAGTITTPTPGGTYYFRVAAYSNADGLTADDVPGRTSVQSIVSKS